VLGGGADYARGGARPWRVAIRHVPASRRCCSTGLDAAIERVTPDVVALLADGVPRAEAAIVAALAGRHPKDDIRRTLMRLDVTEQLVETGGRYALPADEAGPG
jgi:hypothetical protein